jgi:hypothetical protein
MGSKKEEKHKSEERKQAATAAIHSFIHPSIRAVTDSYVTESIDACP